MRKDSINFATKMIADIRNQMNADAIANGVKKPTDTEVEVVVDQNFSLIVNKSQDDYVLRKATNFLGSGFWWVEGPIFGASFSSPISVFDPGIPIPPSLPPPITSFNQSPSRRDLVLSLFVPNVQTTVSSGAFIDDLAVTTFIDDTAEVNFTSDP